MNEIGENQSGGSECKEYSERDPKGQKQEAVVYCLVYDIFEV